MNRFVLPYPAVGLIPHREAMLFLSELKEYDENFAASELIVEQTNLFLNDDQTVNSLAFIEMLAQLIAAHSGFKAKIKDMIPKAGFLVGIKDFTIYETAKLGDELSLTVQKEMEFANAYYINGKVAIGERCLAEGVLKLWEAPSADLKNEKIINDSIPEKTFFPDESTYRMYRESSSLHRDIMTHITSIRSDHRQGNVQAHLFFPPDFIAFNGHFPGNPILPGVIMLNIGLIITELFLSRKLLIQKIASAKFSKLVSPQQVIGADIHVIDEGLCYKTKVKLSTQEGSCAEFIMMLKKLKFD